MSSLNNKTYISFIFNNLFDFNWFFFILNIENENHFNISV